MLSVWKIGGSSINVVLLETLAKSENEKQTCHFVTTGKEKHRSSKYLSKNLTVTFFMSTLTHFSVPKFLIFSFQCQLGSVVDSGGTFRSPSHFIISANVSRLFLR